MELATGAPLFPGESDIDQLWLIIKVLRPHRMESQHTDECRYICMGI